MYAYMCIYGISRRARTRKLKKKMGNLKERIKVVNMITINEQSDHLCRGNKRIMKGFFFK